MGNVQYLNISKEESKKAAKQAVLEWWKTCNTNMYFATRRGENWWSRDRGGPVFRFEGTIKYFANVDQYIVQISEENKKIVASGACL